MKAKNEYLENDILSIEQQHILYKTYYKSVFKTIYYFVKDREISKDLTNDAYIKAFENYDSLKEKNKFKSWICNIGLNLAKKYIRKHSKIDLVNNIEIFDLEIESIEDELIKKISEKEMRNRVRSAISKLDIKYKEVILLRYYNQLSCNEIANQLNLNINTIYTRINRSKEKLTKLLILEGEIYE